VIRLTRLLLCLTVVLGVAPAVASDGGPTYDRLYLLGGEGDYLYWGVDPTDPELGQPVMTRHCGPARVGGVPGESTPCLMGISPPTLSYNLFFMPASVLEEPVGWSAAAPLRFRLALNVTAAAPYTVHLVIQKGLSQSVSPAATETAPGIWEGTLTTGAPLQPDATNLLGIRVITQAPAATLRVGGAGESSIAFPSPFAARSVPDLIAGDTYAPARTSFASATHAFRFNDDQWSVQSFSGDLGPTASFPMDLPRDARTLFAWVEVFGSPALQDVWRGRSLDRRKLDQGASVTLSRDGEVIDHSGTGSGVAGIGIETMAVIDVESGPLEVSVDAVSEEAEDRMPFKVYVLATHGDRTLRSFRARFHNPRSTRNPAAGVCPAPSVPVPFTQEVRSFKMDLDWDTEAIGLSGWTLRFYLPGVGDFPCGEAGNGDSLRMTVPGTDVILVGSTPPQDRTFVSVADTVFDLQVDYVYTPPPPPDEAAS
jgi:hypothetical protein